MLAIADEIPMSAERGSVDVHYARGSRDCVAAKGSWGRGASRAPTSSYVVRRRPYAKSM